MKASAAHAILQKIDPRAAERFAATVADDPPTTRHRTTTPLRPKVTHVQGVAAGKAGRA